MDKYVSTNKLKAKIISGEPVLFSEPAEKVWNAIGRKPLFGTHSGKKMQTFFGVFMKFKPEAEDE